VRSPIPTTTGLFVKHSEIGWRLAAAWTERDWPITLHTLIQALVGSTAHGTYIPSYDPHHIDDVDVLGAFVPPHRYFTGLSTMEHWVWQEFADGSRAENRTRDDSNLDVCMYEVRKMARLLLKGNPNVLGLLWQPRTLDLVAHPMWDEWRAQRHIFLSRRVHASFAGYALGQLSRLGRPNTRGYMGKDRKALFEKYGYDIKNAAHCVRLLRMGLELLETGELHVDRSGIDAEELKAIKRGGWTLGQVERVANDGLARLREAEQRSTLPERPDEPAVERLVMRTVEAFW